MIGLQLQDALGILETLLVLLALVQLLHNETDTKHHQRESAQPHPMVARSLAPRARSDTHDDLLAHGLLRQRQLLLRLLACLTHLSRYLSLTRSQPSRTHQRHRCANNQNTTRVCVCLCLSIAAAAATRPKRKRDETRRTSVISGVLSPGHVPQI
mgnify:CR=1 FL=1